MRAPEVVVVRSIYLYEAGAPVDAGLASVACPVSVPAGTDDKCVVTAQNRRTLSSRIRRQIFPFQLAQHSSDWLSSVAQIGLFPPLHRRCSFEWENRLECVCGTWNERLRLAASWCSWNDRRHSATADRMRQEMSRFTIDGRRGSRNSFIIFHSSHFTVDRLVPFHGKKYVAGSLAGATKWLKARPVPALADRLDFYDHIGPDGAAEWVGTGGRLGGIIDSALSSASPFTEAFSRPIVFDPSVG